MRNGFVHEAVVRLRPGGDPAAVGAAVTVALCGQWEHEPPCPLAPHNTAALPQEDALAVRVRFACAPSDEARARELIDAALHGGHAEGPTGEPTTWEWVSSGPAPVEPSEGPLLLRLARS